MGARVSLRPRSEKSLQINGGDALHLGKVTKTSQWLRTPTMGSRDIETGSPPNPEVHL
ncbi:hypothetical protein VCH24_04880 [Variovorax boronicumulans]|nr:hypothetical protein VCH24_04880 [Variovorax boronicumulans]